MESINCPLFFCTLCFCKNRCAVIVTAESIAASCGFLNSCLFLHFSLSSALCSLTDIDSRSAWNERYNPGNQYSHESLKTLFDAGKWDNDKSAMMITMTQNNENFKKNTDNYFFRHKNNCKFDDSVKSRFFNFSVIPAKTGIQLFQVDMDSRFRGNDGVSDFLHIHQI